MDRVVMRRYPLKKTEYKGVYFIVGTDALGKPEKIYYVSYYRDGKRHFESVGRERKHGMTAKKSHYIRADKERGLLLPNLVRREEVRKAISDKWTFDRLWKEWVGASSDRKGITNDNSRYRTHLQPLFGNKTPSELTATDVDQLRIKLRQEKYAIGTIVSILSLLRRVTNFAAKRRLCSGLNFKVEMPKGAKQKTEDMTSEQMAEYIKVCKEWADPQAGNFQLLALYTGMRRGELRKLKWADIDSRGFILIREPKGGEDVKIPISDVAAGLLQSHPRVEGNPYVFAGQRGGQRGIKQIAESSREIRTAAGLPDDFRPSHGLRHTFASHLASSGEVDLYTLQRLMTHKSPTMTQRYAHLHDDSLKRGTNVMSRIVEGNS